MAAIASDPPKYTHELKAVGVPREQAESQAFIDKRFAEVDNRFVVFEAKMESNFSKVYLMFGLTITTATIPICRTSSAPEAHSSGTLFIVLNHTLFRVTG